MSYSSEQVLSFAPDTLTARKGEELASLRKWRNLAAEKKVAWGECKSSDSAFYKTQIDLNTPAFKCNCPSRKFPCKHAIGLMLLYVGEPNVFQSAKQYPDWVMEWLEKRGIVTEEENARDLEAESKKKEERLKNRDARMTLMASGMEDLSVWLSDLIRQGLASTDGHSLSYWQNIASRMVDSKLGGIGRRIRKFPLLQSSGMDWPDRMLAEIAQLYLLINGFEKLEELPPLLQTELLTISGVNIKKEEVLVQKGMDDDWLVVGLREGVEENLNFRHTWLYGSNSGELALILEFSFGDTPYPHTWKVGQAFNGEVVYFPAAYQIRALVKTQKNQVALFEAPIGYHSLERFFDNFAKALALNPWIINFPCYLEEIIPVIEKGKLMIIDNEHKYIEAVTTDNIAWKLMALSGGQPVSLFGEWTGTLLIPLSVVVDGNVVPL